MKRMSESIRWIKRMMDRIVFSLFGLFFRTREGANTILVIRTDGIGDLVFSLPFVRNLKEHFRDHRLVLVCRDAAAPLAQSDLFDSVVPFHYMQYRWNYFYRLIIISRIRTFTPSYTLYLSYHRQHIGDEMAILSGAERVVAFDGNDEIIHPDMRRANDRHYSDIVHADDHSPESEKYRLLLEKLGVSSGGELEKLKGSLGMSEGRERGLPEKAIVLTPGGSSALRRWPPERFAELGDRLAQAVGTKVILCGNQHEKALLAAIAGKMSKPCAVECDLPIETVAMLIKKAKLVVGNESGLVHIAASLGTPAVVILGGGHYSRYFPYGSAKIVNHKLDCYECNWKCPFPEPYCLTRISVEEVVMEVERIVGRDTVPT